ncbi:MAG TPA: DUF4214 domain-containing protein [Thermoanaerobaculia bacterium]|nr:DUF4214 domain-containing protein [Thermoanaerobaculia bacterium]
MPTITVDPQSQTIASGGAVTLTVGNGGTGPFTYQWYQGQSGDLSNPIFGANASQFMTPPLTQTTSFWVRVSNACGSADSRAATITVTGACVAPSFTMQPGSLTLDSGQQTFLAATATNATSYQWFKGAAGDESNPMSGGATPSNARFVNQIYIDVLGRPADIAAVNALAPQLDSMSATRAQVAQVVLTSNEYRTNLIVHYYNAYLHRAPTAMETLFWMPAFTAGITDEQLASQFVGSGEYFALAASSNAVWLSHVFNDVLGRSPTPADLSFFAAALATNSRTTIALTVLTSAEVRARLVKGWFSRFLRRSATAAELSSFVAALTAAKDEQVMALILALDEYFNFGTILPTGALSSTTSFWVKATNGNCSTNSSTAILTIPSCAPPVIVDQPQNTTINVGGTAALSVNATGATSYQWYRATSGDPTNPIGTSPVLKITQVLAGIVDFWVKVSNACGSVNSATVVVTTNCVAPKPVISALPTVPSVQAFVVTWTGGEQVTSRFDLDEARSPDFTIGLRTFEVMTNSSAAIQHMEIAADTRFYYRVRSDPLCGGVGEYSQTASVLVTAPVPATNPSFNLVSSQCTELQACSLTQNLFIAGFAKSGKKGLDTNDTFAVTSDKPFITANPSSGPLPPEGANVVLTINTSVLQTGSTEATLTVAKIQPSSKGVLGTTSSTVPVSVSLVTPVTPTPKDSIAPANTVLVPAIAHADGFNSQFQSDVRITNTAQQPITYLLTYTPSNMDGTQNGKQSSIEIAAGETKALNDVVKNWYGSGTLGEPGIGTLEIRPLNYSGKTGVDVSFATVAASRTYNTAANGTFGQYIPAIPLMDFLAKSSISKISLQQIAQGTAYRTNFGFVEGSGQPVDFVATLFDDKNNMIATRSYSLRPFEHQQTSLGNFFPGVSVNDGRIEVIVTSDTGRLTAYASVLDNTTSDPLLVFPVDPSKISSSRFVVPGVAELNNGAANFHTDMRVFNGSTTSTNVTLSFPANSALQPVQKLLAAGEVWAIDNVLPALWNTAGGGAVVATSNSAASLVVTARTYSRGSDGGTFGQFIPGVTAADAIGVGDRPLQVVQLEQSPAFRSNLGLVEVTGNPVTLDVAAYTPESKIAAHTTVTLAPGQFTQLGSIFAGLGFTSNVYNGRIAVTATGGTGRAAAYGSVIDNRTQDPTYVPAQ